MGSLRKQANRIEDAATNGLLLYSDKKQYNNTFFGNVSHSSTKFEKIIDNKYSNMIVWSQGQISPKVDDEIISSSAVAKSPIFINPKNNQGASCLC